MVKVKYIKRNNTKKKGEVDETLGTSNEICSEK